MRTKIYMEGGILGIENIVEVIKMLYVVSGTSMEPTSRELMMLLFAELCVWRKI